MTMLFQGKYKQNDMCIYSTLVGENRFIGIGFCVRMRFYDSISLITGDRYEKNPRNTNKLSGHFN